MCVALLVSEIMFSLRAGTNHFGPVRYTCIHSHIILAGTNGLKCRDRVQTGVETGIETVVDHVETIETA